MINNKITIQQYYHITIINYYLFLFTATMPSGHNLQVAQESRDFWFSGEFTAQNTEQRRRGEKVIYDSDTDSEDLEINEKNGDTNEEISESNTRSTTCNRRDTRRRPLWRASSSDILDIIATDEINHNIISQESTHESVRRNEGEYVYRLPHNISRGVLQSYIVLHHMEG